MQKLVNEVGKVDLECFYSIKMVNLYECLNLHTWKEPAESEVGLTFNSELKDELRDMFKFSKQVMGCSLCKSMLSIKKKRI